MAAASFLRTTTVKNVVRGYARWFGVDLGCALKELQLLDVHVDPTYVDSLLATLRERERIGRQRSELRRQAREDTARWFDFESTGFADEAIGPPTDIPF